MGSGRDSNLLNLLLCLAEELLARGQKHLLVLTLNFDLKINDTVLLRTQWHQLDSIDIPSSIIKYEVP